jgi:hypothetical protein
VRGPIVFWREAYCTGFITTSTPRNERGTTAIQIRLKTP